MPLASAHPPPAASPAPIRVMIVDDSVVVRGLTARWLEEAGYVVAATAQNGRVAIDQIERANPDIVLLDIEMPEMDGITALPILQAKAPRASIVVISTLTQRNAQISLKCLSLGAVDYLAKPESHRGVTTSASFRHDLLSKVQALGPRAARLGARQAPVMASPSPVAPLAGSSASQPAVPPREPLFRRAPGLAGTAGSAAPAMAGASRTDAGAVQTRPRPIRVAPRMLLIGSSTGGPRAVGEFLAAAAPALGNIPICVVQHMPPIFTAVFAEHLSAQVGLPAAEGTDGARLENGRIYVAPGGIHMGLRRDATGAFFLRLQDGPPVNFCKPAVDVLFNDAAATIGAAALAIVLTGMGSDGTHGARALVEAGACVMVQDEATSTVWGMPGSIAKAGLAHEILPIPALAAAAKRYITGSLA